MDPNSFYFFNTLVAYRYKPTHVQLCVSSKFCIDLSVISFHLDILSVKFLQQTPCSKFKNYCSKFKILGQQINMH